MKKIIIVVALAILALTAGPAMAERELLPPDPNLSGDFTQEYMGERIIVDVFLIRPLSFAGALIGMAASVPALPFAAVSNSTDRLGDTLIRQPLDYTFQRPVGDINF